jgi:hypothetical protein
MIFSVMSSILWGCQHDAAEEKRLLAIHNLLDSVSTQNTHKSLIQSRYTQYSGLESPSKEELGERIGILTKQLEVLIKELGKVKKELHTYTIHDSSKSPSKPLTAQAYLLGEGNNKSKTYQIDSLLQGYIRSFRKYSGLQVGNENFYPFYMLSLDNIRNPNVQSADETEYIATQFKNLSPLQSLLVIDQIQSRLLMYHNQFIDISKTLIWGSDEGISTPRIIISPQNHIIEEGEDYVAEMYFGFINERTAHYNGQACRVLNLNLQGEDITSDFNQFTYGYNQRKFTFPVRGGSPQGETKEWKGTLTLGNAMGEDTTIHLSRTYTVYSK